MSKPILHGERVTLRPPQETDKQDRFACGRDPDFRRMMGDDWRTSPSLTMEEVQNWYARDEAAPFAWMIEYAGRCIGGARLHAVDADHDRRARYAIGIFDPTCRGQGLGTDVTRLVLGYAFTQLHLHRVDLRVLTFNHRAIACYEKCGFVREGIEREGAWIAGRWESDVMMSILEQEYHA